MADTIERRVSDLEQMLGHLPGDLDARFADARAGARFDRLSIRLQAYEAKVQEGQVTTATQIAGIENRITKIDTQIAGLDSTITRIETKRDEVPNRLPKST